MAMAVAQEVSGAGRPLQFGRTGMHADAQNRLKLLSKYCVQIAFRSAGRSQRRWPAVFASGWKLSQSRSLRLTRFVPHVQRGCESGDSLSRPVTALLNVNSLPFDKPTRRGKELSVSSTEQHTMTRASCLNITLPRPK